MATILETAQVVSDRTGELYTIKRFDDYTASCTCPGWISSKARECKHIREKGWGRPKVDGYALAAKVANIFGPAPYLSDILKAIIAEDDEVKKLANEGRRTRNKPMSDIDRRVLMAMLEWFDTVGFASPGDTPNEGTTIADAILTRAIQLRNAPAVGKNGQPLANPEPDYRYIARRIQRERSGRGIFKVKWMMTVKTRFSRV